MRRAVDEKYKPAPLPSWGEVIAEKDREIAELKRRVAELEREIERIYEDMAGENI